MKLISGFEEGRQGNHTECEPRRPLQNFCLVITNSHSLANNRVLLETEMKRAQKKKTTQKNQASSEMQNTMLQLQRTSVSGKMLGVPGCIPA